MPKEHAEGRSQYDYLRRLADEVAQLDKNRGDNGFAENGVKAIGIIGNDVYDKLLILQALRSRFGDKIFFTTDLDARYLHADQKDWARNLVVASNFGLSLRPELQQSTLPFRDGYQAATYLATLMALEEIAPNFDWSSKMENWLHPQLFEIGRTEAVHLASPTLKDLTSWYNASKKGDSKTEVGILENKNSDIACVKWVDCMNIDPVRLSHAPSHLMMVLLIAFLVFLLIALISRYIHETWPVAKN